MCGCADIAAFVARVADWHGPDDAVPRFVWLVLRECGAAAEARPQRDGQAGPDSCHVTGPVGSQWHTAVASHRWVGRFQQALLRIVAAAPADVTDVMRHASSATACAASCWCWHAATGGKQARAGGDMEVDEALFQSSTPSSELDPRLTQRKSRFVSPHAVTSPARDSLVAQEARAMDSFRTLFCRLCCCYDCRRHGCAGSAHSLPWQFPGASARELDSVHQAIDSTLAAVQPAQASSQAAALPTAAVAPTPMSGSGGGSCGVAGAAVGTVRVCGGNHGGAGGAHSGVGRSVGSSAGGDHVAVAARRGVVTGGGTNGCTDAGGRGGVLGVNGRDATAANDECVELDEDAAEGALLQDEHIVQGCGGVSALTIDVPSSALVATAAPNAVPPGLQPASSRVGEDGSMAVAVVDGVAVVCDAATQAKNRPRPRPRVTRLRLAASRGRQRARQRPRGRAGTPKSDASPAAADADDSELPFDDEGVAQPDGPVSPAASVGEEHPKPLAAASPRLTAQHALMPTPAGWEQWEVAAAAKAWAAMACGVVGVDAYFPHGRQPPSPLSVPEDWQGATGRMVCCTPLGASAAPTSPRHGSAGGAIRTGPNASGAPVQRVASSAVAAAPVAAFAAGVPAFLRIRTAEDIAVLECEAQEAELCCAHGGRGTSPDEADAMQDDPGLTVEPVRKRARTGLAGAAGDALPAGEADADMDVVGAAMPPSRGHMEMEEQRAAMLQRASYAALLRCPFCRVADLLQGKTCAQVRPLSCPRCSSRPPHCPARSSAHRLHCWPSISPMPSPARRLPWLH